MRARLYSSFQTWVDQYKDDPLRADAYERSLRIRDMLAAVTPVTDETPIPGDSLLREFIGGSVYAY
jgi:uridine kinase